MHRPLEFKVWSGLSWMGTLLFWGIPPCCVHLVLTGFQSFLAHPMKFLPLAALLFTWYAFPFTFGTMIIRIQKEGDELVFTSIGRPAFLPWGPRSEHHRVPALASFEWSRPYLSATHGEIAWQFKLAVFFHTRQIPAWFQEVGLPKPQGL